MFTAASLVLRWPWCYFDSNPQANGNQEFIAYNSLFMFALAGLINLTLTIIFLREHTKIRNNVNVVLGGFSTIMIMNNF